MGRADDLIVVGGGVIGLAIAREAAGAGFSVRLFDRGGPGAESSAASAGLLTPLAHATGGGPLLDLALRGLRLYPRFVEALAAETGIDPELERQGALQVAATPAGIAEIERQHAFQRAAGYRVERLDSAALRRLEPELGPACAAGLLFPDHAVLDSPVLVRALAASARRRGVRLIPQTAVEEVLATGDRVAGVRAGGRDHAAGAVVLAAGAWTGSIAAGSGWTVPTHPVRGQIVCLGPTSAVRRPIFGEEAYLSPRRDGRLLVGSTMERVGFVKGVTAGAIAALAGAAAGLVPALHGAPFHSAWSGLRPATADGLPAIGHGPRAGLIYACGHLREGILLAPITARIVLDLLRGVAPAVDLRPFDPRRFAPGP